MPLASSLRAPVELQSSKPIEAQWHQAAKIGDVEHMKSLVASKKELLNHHQKGIGHTALHWSASAGQMHVVEWLLSEGFSPIDTTNSSDSTALHSAAGGGHIDIVKRLLAAGADKTLVDEDKQTPASLAKSRGHADVAAALS